MPTYARIAGNVVLEVFVLQQGQSLAEYFPPALAGEFEAVPDSVTAGSVRFGTGEWSGPQDGSAGQEPPAVEAAKVSPVEFKLLFTPQERVSISSLRKTDPMLEDFMSIIDDPRLSFVDMGLPSTSAGVAYALQALAAEGTIAADSVEARTAEILAGVYQ